MPEPKPRPLSPKARRFAELYAGDATKAAAAAGYTGTRASLAVTGSRLLRDPRVQSIIEGRRRRTRGAAPAETDDDSPPDDGPLSDATPVGTLQALMTDDTVTASTRARCAELLARREDAASAAVSDPYAALRVALQARFRVRREREREEARARLAAEGRPPIAPVPDDDEDEDDGGAMAAG